MLKAPRLLTQRRPSFTGRHASASTLCSGKGKTRLMFMGSPDFAASVLTRIHSKVGALGAEIVAVTTPPPCAINGPTPVAKQAKKLGIPTLTPASPGDAEYLSEVRDVVRPDLCLTVAYGGFLPMRFLSIPPLGTLNIHPSLLPRYRGAAPVQRCLENGDTETGVTLLQTVLRMDAGPVVGQRRISLRGDEKAPEVLRELFSIGVDMFLDALPVMLRGDTMLTPQADEGVTQAPKIQVSETLVDFRVMSATAVHNRCRAFADKPGIRAMFARCDGEDKPFELKIVDTRVLSAAATVAGCGAPDAALRYVPAKAAGNSLGQAYYAVTCADGSQLALLAVQPLTKRPMTATDLHNGMRKAALRFV